jgi:hypothetical protein
VALQEVCGVKNKRNFRVGVKAIINIIRHMAKARQGNEN